MSVYETIFGKNNSENNLSETKTVNAPRADVTCQCDKINPNTCVESPQHKCVCHTLGPVWCKYVQSETLDFNNDEHHCICIDNPQLINYCKSHNHHCTCIENDYSTCRADKENHVCSCLEGKYVNNYDNAEQCKYDLDKHHCICEDRLDDRCLSIWHDIKCDCDVLGTDHCMARTHDVCVCDSPDCEDVNSIYGCRFIGVHNCRCEINPSECKKCGTDHKCLCYHRTKNYQCRIYFKKHHSLFYSQFRILRLALFPLTPEECDLIYKDDDDDGSNTGLISENKSK